MAHTYRVVHVMDLEAEDPVQAAMAWVNFMTEFHAMPVGDDDRPILEVRQFVDTDKPPLCVRVDTLDFSLSEEWYDIGATR